MRTMFGLAAVAGDGSLEGHHTATACNVSRGCENEKRVALQSHFVLRSDAEKTKNGLLYRFSFSFLY